MSSKCMIFYTAEVVLQYFLKITIDEFRSITRLFREPLASLLLCRCAVIQ